MLDALLRPHPRRPRRLGLALAAWAVALCGLPAAYAKKPEPTCSKTARAAFRACQAEVQDDYWTAVGRCANTADDAARADCVAAAKEERKTGRKEDCPDQRDARLEVCDALGEAPYDPAIDPASFLGAAGIAAAPNPYFPLVPGSVWRYAGGGESTTVTVTGETREILGIETVVVRDTVMVGGEIVEDTDDYFAQETDGTVWYFGELSKSFENGVLVDLEGSWTAGVDGARPGVIMEAMPIVGDFYRQEFLLGDAEDVAEVTAVDADETVPAASCDGMCVQTREGTALEPDVAEAKYYAPGVGLILEVDLESGDRVELVEYTPGAP